jgi:hypothetical protein
MARRAERDRLWDEGRGWLMAMSMSERLEMLQIASKAWLELKRVMDAIPDRALEQPNTIGHWSGRDMLAHLAGWEAIGIDLVEQMNERGEYTRLGLNRDTVDAFNEEMLAQYSGMSTQEVRQALEETHFALMDLAETSQADIAAIVIDVTRDHYNKHIPDLRGIPTR